ncbi:MAG: hypothetical protein M3O67_01500 [Bacteroidota bacterium]|nr:hypothetical protein [Bacteroidota bacterium]
MIFEEGYDSLAEYEGSLISAMRTDEWQKMVQKVQGTCGILTSRNLEGVM